jgi:hypothetical protein
VVNKRESFLESFHSAAREPAIQRYWIGAPEGIGDSTERTGGGGANQAIRAVSNSSAACGSSLERGLIVVTAGIRVVRETTMQLMDTMPDARLIGQIREAASGVPGVCGVEKCFARKTGFKYHVDLRRFRRVI